MQREDGCFGRRTRRGSFGESFAWLWRRTRTDVFSRREKKTGRFWSSSARLFATVYQRGKDDGREESAENRREEIYENGGLALRNDDEITQSAMRILRGKVRGIFFLRRQGRRRKREETKRETRERVSKGVSLDLVCTVSRKR